VLAFFITIRGIDMQYMLTGLLILIISGLLLNAVSLAIESIYKMLKEMHLKTASLRMSQDNLG
jgi:hypothetical protein